MSWEGKVVVVTGGAQGIGGATSKLFADQGAKVVVFDPDESLAQAHVAAINAGGGKALFVRGSVASEADVQGLARATVDAFGRIDGLVNNAGIMRRHDRVEDWTMDDVRQILDVNLLGLFLTSYTLAPIMARSGGGAIVNLSSVGGLMCVPYSPAYSATKAGVLGMTRSMVPTFGAHGVRVNAILPSLVETSMALASPSAKTLPMLAPADLARAIVHVASDPALTGGFFMVSLSEQGPKLSRLGDEPQFTPVENSPF
jgi:NAD(P)-dependent dehydrogenase (short-subunit alcohol dehydrogenase family)